ncbi:hypothetical protein BD560DRAFT_466754 [Blakeslea trispora]|nr:hypothetical protein BD560DRAFT_466754 [Blakeslea trispora]
MTIYGTQSAMKDFLYMDDRFRTPFFILHTLILLDAAPVTRQGHVIASTSLLGSLDRIAYLCKKKNQAITYLEEARRDSNLQHALEGCRIRILTNNASSTPHILARALSGNLASSSSSALAIPRGEEKMSVHSSFGGSPSGSNSRMNTNNVSSAGLPPLGSVNLTEDVPMDNGSFYDVPTSGLINQNEDTPTVSALFGLFPNDSGHYEDITTDNGISFDLPSSEPAHSSNKESDDREIDSLDLLERIQDGPLLFNTIAPLMDILEDNDEEHLDNAADDVLSAIADTSDADPLKNVLYFVLIAFFSGSKMNFSKAKIESIMTMIRLLFKLKEKNNDLELSTTYFVLNFQESKTSRIPAMTPSKHTGVNKAGETHELFMNKPSEYLKFLMADPLKSPQLSALPDNTTCETKSLQQGSNWRTHKMFQQLMKTLENGNDVWVNDLVTVNITGNWNCILVSNFFTKKEDLNFQYVTYFKGFPVMVYTMDTGSAYVAIDQNEHDSRGSPLAHPDFLPISADHKALPYWIGDYHAMDVQRTIIEGGAKKVVVAPLILFFDDTSGNLSKQYNLFNSYSMTPAALSFDARSSKNNAYFLCTPNKKLSAVEMLPALNKRPKTLRKNASAAARAAHEANRFNPTLLSVINHGCGRQTLMQMKEFASPVPTTDMDFFNEKGFGKNCMELLKLEAYDPTLDTPVKLLHNVRLSVGKGLVQLLWTKVLTSAQQVKLQSAISNQRTFTAYTRNSRAKLNHHGSFAGRDFKQLIQVLPVILKDTFSDDMPQSEKLDLIAKCFSTLGCLTSLLYMRSVEGALQDYVSLATSMVNELTRPILVPDNHFLRNNIILPSGLSLQPKLDLLYHLQNDILRFGLPIHYEIENGEQFNKFIREEILCTNRHNPSKDVATSFAKQFIIHHIINGGSFVVTKTRRDGTKESKRIMGAGPEIKRLKEEEPNFFDLILNHREEADNKDYYEKTDEFLMVNTTGIFKSSSCMPGPDQIGIIESVKTCAVQKDGEDFKKLSILLEFTNLCVLIQLTTLDNNVVMKKSTVVRGYANEIELVQRLDMHLSCRFNNPQYQRYNAFRLLNVHKFGTLWSLRSLYNRRHN